MGHMGVGKVICSPGVYCSRTNLVSALVQQYHQGYGLITIFVLTGPSVTYFKTFSIDEAAYLTFQFHC